jgi:hypothetical protein
MTYSMGNVRFIPLFQLSVLCSSLVILFQMIACTVLLLRSGAKHVHCGFSFSVEQRLVRQGR